MRAHRITLLLLPIVASILASGCAILAGGDVELAYPPGRPRKERVVPGLDDWRAAEILILPFDDCRDDTATVGELFDPATGTVEAITADGSVREWIASAIRYELRQAGYRAVFAEHHSGRDEVTAVSGDVELVQNTGAFQQGAEVSFSIRVTRGGQPLILRRYVGHGSAGSGYHATPSLYGRSLALALAEAVHSLVADIRATMDTASR